MEYIDINNWKRKEHFTFFYKMDYPQYNVCMDLDITRFLAYIKEREMSFYYSTVFAVTHVANELENFRYRIREGQVVLHDKIHPSFTDMNDNPEDDLFRMLTCDLTETMTEFVEVAKAENENQKGYFNPQKTLGRDDLVYITCLPWISFTHLSHTILLNRNDAVPRLSWGKYYKDGDRVLLPFSVQVHHALVDGFHVGKYIEKLQDYLNSVR